MEMEKNGYRAHCLVLTYPVQGHINPMMEFSKRLQHKGVKVTFVITNFISKTMHKEASSIALETISDGYDEGGLAQAESIYDYQERFQRVGSQTLTQLIEKLSSSSSPVDGVVYDPFLPWALDIAKSFGLLGAMFLTQSCAVDNIYYHAHKGVLKLPLSDTEILLPGSPPLQLQDLPSFISDFESQPAYYDLLVGQFSNVDKADWVLVNTFYELEQEVRSFSQLFKKDERSSVILLILILCGFMLVTIEYR
jgi:pathogen-inducible salicylic acid glucosyltransferase